MTGRLNLGHLVAGVSIAAMLAAIVAGLMSVANPIDARAYRLDAARLNNMVDLAIAANCVRSATGDTPETTIALRQALREHPELRGDCDDLRADFELDPAIVYRRIDKRSIELCAQFQRPSPATMERERNTYWSRRRARVPELNEPRAEAGRNCFVVLLAPSVSADPANPPTAAASESD